MSGILLVVVMVGSLAVIRARRMNVQVTRVQSEEVEATEYGDPGETVGRYLGFNFEERFRGRLVFALSSIKTLATTSGWNEIEGVRLELFQMDGKPVILSCDSASFNEKTRDARLRGSVHIQFPDGGFIDTERGLFDAASRRFSTDGRTTFAGNGGIGETGRIKYWLDEDRLKLEDGLTVRMEGGARLQAPSLVYFKSEGKGALTEGCSISANGVEANAERCEMWLDGPEGSVRRLSLLGDVKVKGRDIGGASYVKFAAERLYADRQAGETWQITAQSKESWVEGEFYEGPGFVYRRLQSFEIRGVVGPQGLLRVIARRQLCLYDVPTEGATRTAQARRGTFRLGDNRGIDVTLEGSVEINNESMMASASRADYSGSNGLTLLQSDADNRKRVVLASGRGELTCNDAQFDQETGRAEAQGNVQGHIEDTQLLMGETDGQGSNPLHFAAQTLVVEENGAVFHLRDNARAWQGNNLLLADEIIHRSEDESLRAFGHVRTTFSSPPPSSTDETDEATDQEVLVVARALDYQRSEQGAQAVYSGNVRYSDAEHTMSTAELAIDFDVDNEIQTVEAEGAVELIHGVTGRRMKGQHALREMKTQQVHITGNPVQVSDEKGNLITGTSLTWDQASGRVTISGGPESRTETILYPEEER
ncbi:MAG: hypothetical protein GY906_13390 [bacterium]|nr:hypothetical protein [bacterium]